MMLETVRCGIDGLLSVLLSACCAACGRLLDRPTAGPVCGGCWAGIRSFTPPFCHQCGEPLASWRTLSQAFAACPRCRRVRGSIEASRAIGPYEGTLRQIVHAFKYDGRRTLAAPLAALMRREGAGLLDGADLIVPVPLHPRRHRARGFNQAADLAGHLGVPVGPILRRVRDTASQTELPAAQRHRNVRGAFAIDVRGWRRLSGKTAGSVSGRDVVLVDDVSTTGATLEACARVLKAAGARRVCALTAARVQAPERTRSLQPLPSSIVRRRSRSTMAAPPGADSSREPA